MFEKIGEQIEEFLFDVMGLLLPGLVGIGVTSLTIALVSGPQSVLLPVEALLRAFQVNYGVPRGEWLVAILLLVAYVLGHFVKVFSKWVYEVFAAIFDHGFFRWKVVQWISLRVGRLSKNEERGGSTKWTAWVAIINLRALMEPMKRLCREVFTFRPLDFGTNFSDLHAQVVATLSERMGLPATIQWHPLYKICTQIIEQENLHSLYKRFLAKYNSYRSMAFIFLFNALWLTWAALKQSNGQVLGLAIVEGLLWFTFHEKYKRYWMLCGNEILVPVYYHLHKAKGGA